MGMTLGWSIDAAARDSRTKRSRNSGSSASCWAMSFSATRRSRSSWVSRYTTPIPPRPASPSTRWPAKTSPGESAGTREFYRLRESRRAAAALPASRAKGDVHLGPVLRAQVDLLGLLAHPQVLSLALARDLADA